MNIPDATVLPMGEEGDVNFKTPEKVNKSNIPPEPKVEKIETAQEKGKDSPKVSKKKAKAKGKSHKG